MMNERKGIVFSIYEDNLPVEGCTISKELVNEPDYQLFYFSLAAHTDISPETYQKAKVIYVLSGGLSLYGEAGDFEIPSGQALVVPAGVAVGMRSQGGAVYVEITIEEESLMNIDTGKLFSLADLVPCQDGKIINRDIIQSPKMKFVIMSFGAGTGLSEHAAPGEALIFALEGKAVINYEGQDFPIKAGENFAFAKNGRHAVTADGPFKMALLLTLD